MFGETKETTCKSKDTVKRKGEILNGKTFARMIKEYAAFRKQHVRHFRYDAKAESTNFGEFDLNFKVSLHQSLTSYQELRFQLNPT